MINSPEESKRIRYTDPERLPLGWSDYPNITPDRYAAVVKTIPYGDVAALEDILDAAHINKPTSAFTGSLPPQVYLEALTREYLEASRQPTGQKVQLGRKKRVKVVSPEQLRFRQMSDALVRARPIYNTLELDRHSKALSQYHRVHPRFRTPLVMSKHFLQEERGGARIIFMYSCLVTQYSPSV